MAAITKEQAQQFLEDYGDNDVREPGITVQRRGATNPSTRDPKDLVVVIQKKEPFKEPEVKFSIYGPDGEER